MPRVPWLLCVLADTLRGVHPFLRWVSSSGLFYRPSSLTALPKVLAARGGSCTWSCSVGLRSGGGLLGFVVVGNSVGGKDGSGAVQWGAEGGETALDLLLLAELSWRSLGDSRAGIFRLHGSVTA